MESPYGFKVSSFSASGSENRMNKQLVINCFSHDMIPTNLYLHLEFGYSTKNELVLINITLGAELTAEEEFKNIYYLMGVFGFLNEEVLKKSLNELKERLNGKDHRNFPTLHSGKKWREFSLDFIDWFKGKIRPAMIKDIETHRMYF